VSVSDDQNWRLRADLDQLEPDERRSELDRLLGRVREPEVVREAGAAVGHDVAITHDGDTLFAYAATESALATARKAIEAVLRGDGIGARIVVSHFDERFDEWLQIDPPLTGQAGRAAAAKERDEQKVESRTMVASSGKLIRSEFEQTMRNWADELGLHCEVIEHPHMLTAQVAFTVTGPRRKLDEFAEGLRAEELATMRTEREVMLSPL
jgi:hypothetical protein